MREQMAIHTHDVPTHQKEQTTQFSDTNRHVGHEPKKHTNAIQS